VIRRRGTRRPDRLSKLVADAEELVGRLVEENRALRASNAKLAREVDRLSQGWEQIKKLAREAPKARRRR
jgi:cell division protein FtsB